MAKNTKMLGVRLESELVDSFKDACHNLPITFKPSELLKTYMQHIVSTSEQYKKTGKCSLAYFNSFGKIVIIGNNGVQEDFVFDE